MISNECVIIIPIYKEIPNEDDAISINNTYKQFNDKFDIFFICSNKLNINAYKKFKIKFIEFDECYFMNVNTYSQLCMSTIFYEKFLNYEYMLIAQPDAYIFENTLSYWCQYCKQNNIYMIGGLTKKGGEIEKYNNEIINCINKQLKIKDLSNCVNEYICVNGGLSLRNIKTLYDVCKNINILNYDINDLWEDIELSKIRELNVQNILVKDACLFSIEWCVDILKELKNVKPFGCHNAYVKYQIQNILS